MKSIFSLLFFSLAATNFCVLLTSAKPTNSMTRIQEVFRTLMGANKPMMIESRGKKSIVDNNEHLPSDAMYDSEVLAQEYGQLLQDYAKNIKNDGLKNDNFNHRRIVWLLNGQIPA